MTKILAESLEEFRSNREDLNEAIAISNGDLLKLFLKAPEHRKADARFKKAFKWQLQKMPSLEQKIDALDKEAKINFAKSALAWLKEKPGQDNLIIPYNKDLNGVVTIDVGGAVKAGGGTSARKGVHGGTATKQ